MGSSLSSISDLLRHRRTMPRFKITAILLVLAMIVSSPPTVDAMPGRGAPDPAPAPAPGPIPATPGYPWSPGKNINPVLESGHPMILDPVFGAPFWRALRTRLIHHLQAGFLWSRVKQAAAEHVPALVIASAEITAASGGGIGISFVDRMLVL